MEISARALEEDVSPIMYISQKGGPGRTGEVREKAESSLPGVLMK
jgi:hypothetical protein